MFSIIPSKTCLVSFPSADTSRSTIGPSISWCFILGSSSGFGLRSPLGVEKYFVDDHVSDRSFSKAEKDLKRLSLLISDPWIKWFLIGEGFKESGS
ncbi:hypothetical protein F2Q68_00017868 [Brassica cretica]|uniref:Uncharacterized protein n=1 Tax=Brassica cretica TaxID=69181 RepID=A0A8S9HL50_BRACR|nr:hypothetical protein F2Q68_00017868 [Brassica cretica]